MHSFGDLKVWEDSAITEERIDLLQTISNQIAVAIHNTQLVHESQRQAQRLAVVNEVSKAIGSTIDLDDLLELIFEQLNKVIPSDTYFVAIYNAEEDLQDVRILIDRNLRYPATKVPADSGLASWVLKNKQTLLIHHLSQNQENLPVQPIQLGQDEISESWLGVPLIIGDRYVGMLAIASYTPNAFDQEDATLLENVAAQATLALDNATQHAAVKEQALRDSLTGAYNHGQLLLMLEQAVNQAKVDGSSVSLIMLDIDYFKVYNDLYGHVVGDEVLRLLVKTIQGHIKRSDILGRWGGEEFSIGLPGATSEQALNVAQRIRLSLSQAHIEHKNGDLIPNPTISQGIATFPKDAMDSAQLVDIADMALYRAKQMGRDQIVIAASKD